MTTQPPPGYRFLLAGEIIERGDLCFWHSRWEPCRSTIGSGYDPHWHDTTARRVAAPKPCPPTALAAELAGRAGKELHGGGAGS